jgi:hypothetical protein
MEIAGTIDAIGPTERLSDRCAAREDGLSIAVGRRLSLDASTSTGMDDGLATHDFFGDRPL